MKDYQKLCDSDTTIPIFLQYWWLDAVCGEGNWGLCVAKDNEEHIRAILTYQKIKLKKIINACITPTLTPFSGIWFDEKYVEERKDAIHTKRKLTEQLIAQIPKNAYIELKMHYSFTDWLPFYWAGFKQTTKYTNIIGNNTNIDTIERNFNDNFKRNVKKVEHEIIIEKSVDVALMYQSIDYVFLKQGLKTPYKLDVLKRIFEACSKRGQLQMLFAKDKEENLLASIIIVNDNNAAYSIIGGRLTGAIGSGPKMLLYRKGMRDAHAAGQIFDFEGSMIPGIEQVIRSFSPEQKACSVIYRFPNRLIEMLFLWRKNKT